MHVSEAWEGDSFRDKLLRTLLTPASWAYALGWNCYQTMYAAGLKRPKEPHRPVICVGNLTVGGSGKTPLTLHIAKVLVAQGRVVAISCSGYGSPGSEQATLAPDGELDAREWGDEAALIRDILPHVPLIVGRDRVRAAQICHEAFPEAVLLLDDGFQHLPLKKHLSILIKGRGNNLRCLPAGPYREPANHAKRADLVLPNGFKIERRPLTFRQSSILNHQSSIISHHSSIINPQSSTLSPQSSIIDPQSSTLNHQSSIVEANALCALGSPAQFLTDLAAAGIRVKNAILKPDHDDLMEGNLFAALPPSEPLVVTRKDWVKLKHRRDLGERQIWVADYEVTVEPGEEFARWLSKKLDETQE